MKDLKTIDIIIPVYNDEKNILDAIESAINQINVKVNVIVINDGSNDNTDIVVKESIFYNQIIYIKKDNGGVASARNIGLKNCKSEYCCFLDSDDILEKNFAFTLISELEKNNANFAFSDYVFIEEDDVNKEIVLKRQEIIKNPTIKDLLSHNLFMTPTVIFKRNIAYNILFNEELKYNEDWLFWIDIFNNVDKVVFCDNKLVKIRTRKGGLTSKKEIHATNYLKVIRIIEEKYYNRYKKTLKCAYIKYSNNLRAFKLYGESIIYLFKSFPSTNFFLISPIYLIKLILTITNIDKLIKKLIIKEKDRNAIF